MRCFIKIAFRHSLLLSDSDSCVAAVAAAAAASRAAAAAAAARAAAAAAATRAAAAAAASEVRVVAGRWGGQELCVVKPDAELVRLRL